MKEVMSWFAFYKNFSGFTVLDVLKMNKPRSKEAAPISLMIIQIAGDEGGRKKISLRDIEDLLRMERLEWVCTEGGEDSDITWVSDLDSEVSVSETTSEDFRKVVCMKADFCLLVKESEGSHPLIPKGDTEVNATDRVSEVGRIRSFSFHFLIFLCFYN